MFLTYCLIASVRFLESDSFREYLPSGEEYPFRKILSMVMSLSLRTESMVARILASSPALLW